VIETYGEPQEATQSTLIWTDAGPWKRVVATSTFFNDTNTVEQARDYYAGEFLNVRRKEPTPYMEKLRFTADGDTGDKDSRALSDDALQTATKEGERK
jgi:hypothetical protein